MEKKQPTVGGPKLRGKGSRECRRCHTHRAVIRAYGLYICRRCFREIGPAIGFKKYG
jgi:small subunit ribosomal protein S14